MAQSTLRGGHRVAEASQRSIAAAQLDMDDSHRLDGKCALEDVHRFRAPAYVAQHEAQLVLGSDAPRPHGGKGSILLDGVRLQAAPPERLRQPMPDFHVLWGQPDRNSLDRGGQPKLAYPGKRCPQTADDRSQHRSADPGTQSRTTAFHYGQRFYLRSSSSPERRGPIRRRSRYERHGDQP
jgi:hypothetical protein